MNLLSSTVRPISKEASLYIKGGAIILMLIAHLMPNMHAEFYSINVFTGVSCLAFYALISGYAHALLANKYKETSTIRIAGRCYWNFYVYYLICCAIVMPACLLAGKISASKLPLIIIPIDCSRPFDPWWYAFCYGVFCFAVFPILRWFEKINNNKIFIVSLFLCIVVTVLLPLSFSLPFFHDDFKHMWNSIPILRTVMIIPYYMMGFGYYKYIQNPVKDSLILTLLAISLLLITFFPFSLYNIDGIQAINIGFSFVLCCVVFFILQRNAIVRSFLVFLGGHSTFMWLLHMPINTCYGYVVNHYIPFSVCSSYVVTFLIVFSLSLFVSMLISYIRKKVSFIFVQMS